MRIFCLNVVYQPRFRYCFFFTYDRLGDLYQYYISKFFLLNNKKELSTNFLNSIFSYYSYHNWFYAYKPMWEIDFLNYIPSEVPDRAKIFSDNIESSFPRYHIQEYSLLEKILILKPYI